MNIRLAESKDMPAIMKLYEGERMEKLSELQTKFDPTKVTETIESMIPQGGVIIAELEGIIIGGMVGFAQKGLFSDDVLFCDAMFYFKQEFRGYAKEFLQEIKSLLEQRGITKLVVGSFGEIGYLDRWYKFLGFKLLETHYYIPVRKD